MRRLLQLCVAIVTAAAVAVAVQPAKSSVSKKASVKKTGKKKYVSSSGKRSKVRTAVKKAKATPKKAVTNLARAKSRAAAHDFVYQTVAEGADIPVENAAALIPFFEEQTNCIA